MGVKRFASLNLLITQRPEGSAQLLTEDLRLFPRGEVAALISLVPVDEVAEGTLPPNSRWSVDLGGKHRTPTGTSGMSTASNGPPPACTPSQYNLIDDAPLLVSQLQGDSVKHLRLMNAVPMFESGAARTFGFDPTYACISAAASSDLKSRGSRAMVMRRSPTHSGDAQSNGPVDCFGADKVVHRSG